MLKRISKKDLDLIRAKYRGQLAHGSQTTGQRAERKAQLRGFRLNDDHDNMTIKQIDLITRHDIQMVAKKHLQEPLLSLCGPEKTINKLIKQWR